MTDTKLRSGTLALLAAFTWVAAATGQNPPPPWKGKNLRYFPADIKRDVLIQRMREFSFALSVRCQHCHSGGDGISFDGVEFSADDKPAKLKARAMLQMTDEINETMLPKIPSRAEPRVEVNCATCHHGLRLPKSLGTTLLEIIETDGVAAAVARYKELRKDLVSGLYDFGQWEVNELGRRLIEAKKPTAAIAIFEMNAEYYPEAANLDFQIAELYRELGQMDEALQRYRTTIEKDPGHKGARARIGELEKK